MQQYGGDDSIENIPGVLSSSEEDSKPLQNLSKFFKGANAKQVQDCTRQCVQSCVRGGSGALTHATLFAAAARRVPGRCSETRRCWSWHNTPAF